METTGKRMVNYSIVIYINSGRRQIVGIVGGNRCQEGKAQVGLGDGGGKGRREFGILEMEIRNN